LLSIARDRLRFRCGRLAGPTLTFAPGSSAGGSPRAERRSAPWFDVELARAQRRSRVREPGALPAIGGGGEVNVDLEHSASASSALV